MARCVRMAYVPSALDDSDDEEEEAAAEPDRKRRRLVDSSALAVTADELSGRPAGQGRAGGRGAKHESHGLACPQPACGYVASQRTTMFDHAMTHTGEYLYQCTLCDAFIRKSGDARKHVKRCHPGQLFDAVCNRLATPETDALMAGCVKVAGVRST